MGKILITKNKKDADSWISTNRRAGLEGVNNLLDLYHKNKLPKIKTLVEMQKFLKDPPGYYQTKVSEHIRKTFPDDSALNFSAVENLYKFDFSRWEGFYTEAVVNISPYLDIKPEGTAFLTESWEQKLRDTFFVYAENDLEAEAVLKLRKLSTQIIECFELVKPQLHFTPEAILWMFGIDPDGINIHPEFVKRARFRLEHQLTRQGGNKTSVKKSPY